MGQSLSRLAIVLIIFTLTANAEKLPVEAFGSLPAVTEVKISPDGKNIAYKGIVDGNVFIASVDLATNDKKYLVYTDNKKFKLGWFRCANNETILFSAHYPKEWGAFKYAESRLLKVLANGTEAVKPVFKPRKNDLVPQFQSSVIDFLPNDPDHILMALNLENRQFPSVYKINITSEKTKREVMKRWHPFTEGWITDRQNRLRMGYGVKEDRGFYRLLDLKTNQWRRIWDYEILGEPGIVILGFARDPNTLYIRADHNGRFAIFKVDLSKPNLPRELVFSDPDYDVLGRLIYSQKTNDVIGVYHGEADGAKVFFDKNYNNFQRSLDKAIPNAYNQVVNFSEDESKYILFTSNSREPGAYYLGDREKKLSVFYWINTRFCIAKNYPARKRLFIKPETKLILKRI